MSKVIQQLREIVQSIDPKLIALIEPVLNHPDFFWWPGSQRHHHCYYGGLAKHTLEVLQSAVATSTNLELQGDLRVIAVSVLWHDYGKLFDYYVSGVNHETGLITVPDYKTHASKVGHVARSYLEFTNHFDSFEHGYGYSFKEHIQHCIIAHHGRKEWGSPREPSTPEALIVHQADTLSAMMASGQNPQMR